MAISTTVPTIFVSPEDVVMVENLANATYSPILPDLSIATDAVLGDATSVNDWHYSWMFTGQQNNVTHQLDL